MRIIFVPSANSPVRAWKVRKRLRQLIFQVTCNMKDVGTIGCQRLAGRLVSTGHPEGRLVSLIPRREVGGCPPSPGSGEAGGYPSTPEAGRCPPSPADEGHPHPLEARRAPSPPVGVLTSSPHALRHIAYAVEGTCPLCEWFLGKGAGAVADSSACLVLRKLSGGPEPRSRLALPPRDPQELLEPPGGRAGEQQRRSLVLPRQA